MPTEISPIAVICSIRLVRFWAERKRSFLEPGRSPRSGPGRSPPAARRGRPGRAGASSRAGSRLLLRRPPSAAVCIARRSSSPPRPLGSVLLGILAAVADPGDRRDDVLLGGRVRRAKSPAGRPSRRTKMRSATSKTSTRLWLITTTPSSRSRRRRIRSRTCAVCGDAERRRRLVEQHHLRLAEQRAGDRDLLALAAGEGPDLAAQAGDRHRQVREQVRRSRAPSSPRRAGAKTLPGARRDLLAAEEEVGDDVEVVAEREVLVDGRDPQCGRVLGLGDRDLLAVEADRAVVGGVDAGDRLHQRRLAGAVVADEADDLAGVDGEVDPVQRLDRAESLADSLQLEEWSAAGSCSARDSRFFARRRVGAGAEFGGGDEAVRDHRGLDVVLGHRDRFEQHRRALSALPLSTSSVTLSCGTSSPSARAIAISAAILACGPIAL